MVEVPLQLCFSRSGLTKLVSPGSFKSKVDNLYRTPRLSAWEKSVDITEAELEGTVGEPESSLFFFFPLITGPRKSLSLKLSDT